MLHRNKKWANAIGKMVPIDLPDAGLPWTFNSQKNTIFSKCNGWSIIKWGVYHTANKWRGWGLNPHFYDPKLLSVTLDVESGKAGAHSFDSETHVFSPPENRFHFIINGVSQLLLAWWQCDTLVIAWGLLERCFKKVLVSELEEWVSTWDKISGTVVEHSFKKCYIS